MVHLEPSELSDAYTSAERYARQFHKAFDEYDRLAKNKINPKIDPTMPKVNDGSLAALLKEVPKRVLAQMSTGTVKPEHADDEWLKELINIIWNTRIIPNANSQMPFFDKYRLALYRAVVYGSAPIYTFFNGSGRYPGADFSLPEPRTVYLEEGKVSDLDSDQIWMDVYYTDLQLKSLIKDHKGNKDSPWIAELLQELLDAGVQERDSETLNSEAKEKNQTNKGHKLVACFQRGIKAPFYMFAPAIGNKVVRQWENEDPTGNLPIIYMYADQDLENPYGISQIEFSGPIQNTLDYLTQAFLLATQLGLQPPIEVGGDLARLNKKSLLMAPRQKWYIGDAKVRPVQTNDQTYSLFPQNYGLIKTQLMNQQGTTDASVSGESGNPGYSKTPAGINLQQQRTNANDNYLRQNSATAFARFAQSMINIHVSNSEGSEIIKLYGNDLDKMVRTGLLDIDPETNEPSTDEVKVIWDNLRGEYSFEVDPNSSIGKDDADKVASLMEVVTLAVETPGFKEILMESGFDFKLGELFKQVIMKKGADDWEKILIPISPEQQMQNEQMAMQQQMAAQMPQGQPQLPAEQIPEQPMEMPMEQPVMQEPQADPMQDAIAGIVQEFGVDPQAAMAILHARSEGIPDEEIIAFLQGGNQ